MAADPKLWWNTLHSFGQMSNDSVIHATASSSEVQDRLPNEGSFPSFFFHSLSAIRSGNSERSQGPVEWARGWEFACTDISSHPAANQALVDRRDLDNANNR
jgi:hypothetical protein